MSEVGGVSPLGPPKREIGFVSFVRASDAKLRVPERDDSLGARRPKYEKSSGRPSLSHRWLHHFGSVNVQVGDRDLRWLTTGMLLVNAQSHF